MDVRQPEPSFSTLLTLGLLAASAAAWSVAPAPLAAQEEERAVQERERALILHQEREGDCHCVDGEGEPIENCRCFRMPDMPDLSHIREQAAAWTFPGRSGAWIGVSVEREQEEDDDIRGVRLREVTEDSPAWEAGLRSGDLVLAVDGRSVLEPLTDDAAERRLHPGASPPVQRFLAMVRELEPGEEIRVDYRRDGEERVARLTPEGRPGHRLFGLAGDGPRAAKILSFRGDAPRVRVRVDPCFTGSGPDRGVRGFRFLPDAGCVDGIRLQELNPELGAYFGGADGVLVTEVHEGASLGLEAGDVLLRIGEREVREPEDVRRILRSYGEDEEVTLRVRRRGEVLDVLGTRRPPE